MCGARRSGLWKTCGPDADPRSIDCSVRIRAPEINRFSTDLEQVINRGYIGDLPVERAYKLSCTLELHGGGTARLSERRDFSTLILILVLI